jgi:2-succinyl-6-hydroxy-2,4-cyclohexadiene-1-carboxylate synthase
MPTCQHIHYETCGDKNSNSILFLHGFLGSGRSWDEITDALKSDFFCIVPDLPGHGQSLPHSDSAYSMEATTEALLELLNKEEIRQCSPVGYSMGGRLALYMALKNPVRFSKLVLESASPGLKTDEEHQARVESDNKVIEKLKNVPFEQFIEDWYNQPLFDSVKIDESRFQELLAKMSENSVEGLVKSLQHMGTGAQPSLWDELTNLKLPTLLIVGAIDNKFKAIAREMAKSSEAIQISTISDAGHNVHFERAQNYLEELRKFLK